MPDTITVKSSQSWFSRILGSIVGALIGIILFIAAFPLLWWNEGRAVHRLRSLQEGAAAVIDVPVDQVNPANDGKLVHLTGLATTAQTVADPDFGIAAPALRLERVAETYQWREKSSSSKRKRIGGGEETTTTYTYSKAWSRDRIDSSSFHSPEGHENPASLAWESRTIVADPVTCGGFTLSRALIEKIGGAAPRPGSPDDAEKMQAQGFVAGGGGSFFKGANQADPQVGDVKIHFEVTMPQTVSLVATQRGSTFEAYHAAAGSDVLLLESGTVSAEQMFKSAIASNTLLTWAIRAGGFCAMFLGLVLVLRPISVLGSVIPAIGSLLGAGTGVISFLVALALSFCTIAMAWVAARPLLGLGLIALAVGSMVVLHRTHRKKMTAPPPIPPVAPPPIVPPPIPTR